MSWFRKDVRPVEAVPEGPLAEFVTLRIAGEHFSRWTLKPNEELSALVETLSAHLAARNTGEIRYMESEKGAAVVYLDGPNAEQLFADVLPLLKASPLCVGARVGIDVDVNDKQDFKPKREVTIG